MLNRHAVFIEHRDQEKYICHRCTLFSSYSHSICHLLTCLTEDIGQTGLPRDMSNRVYEAAKQTADNQMLWFWFTLAELQSYHRSVPARQMEALLLQKSCMHTQIKDRVQDILTTYDQPEKDPEDVRFIFWIEAD